MGNDSHYKGDYKENYTQLLKSLYYYLNYQKSALETQGKNGKTC